MSVLINDTISSHLDQQAQQLFWLLEVDAFVGLRCLEELSKNRLTDIDGINNPSEFRIRQSHSGCPADLRFVQ